MSDFAHELEVAKKIARQAGKIMVHYFDIDQQQENKDDGSPVTIADKEVNDLVITELTKEFPNDGIVGEEKSTSQYGAGRRWLCDPIDGTIGYTWGVPTAMFSLALVEDGQPKMGVAYDPFLDRMYWATLGGGSFFNNKHIKVSDKTLADGVVAVTSSVRKLTGPFSHVQALANKDVKMASFSGAVYKSCLVARGKFVGYIEQGVSPYDMAAVHLIIEEAGGKVTGLNGEPLNYAKSFKGAIASNGVVHNQLVAVVAETQDKK